MDIKRGRDDVRGRGHTKRRSEGNDIVFAEAMAFPSATLLDGLNDPEFDLCLKLVFRAKGVRIDRDQIASILNYEYRIMTDLL